MKKFVLMAFCLATVVHAEDNKPSVTTFNPNNEPLVAGKGLNAQEINAVIKSNLNQFRMCFETALKRNPDMKGKVNTAFVVAPSGAVESIFADSADITDRQFLGCLHARAGRWKFPKPRDGQEVSFTYTADFSLAK